MENAKQHVLDKKSEVNPYFCLFMWDRWTKIACSASRHHTSLRSSGFHYFTSKQCGRCCFLLFFSDLIWCQQSVFSSPAVVGYYLCMCLYGLGQLCEDNFTIKKKTLPFGSNYEAKSSDKSCYLIYINVTTMHFPTFDIWQIAFHKKKKKFFFFVSLFSICLYRKWMCQHPVVFGCSCDRNELHWSNRKTWFF